MRGTSVIFKPSQGINNVSDPVDISPLAFVTGKNIDIRRGVSARRRKGYSQAYSGATHSFAGFEDDAYFVEASALKRLNPNYTATTITTLSTNAPADFVRAGNTIVLTNNTDIGFIDNGVYTIPVTPTKRYMTAIVPGRYLTMFKGRLYIVTDTGLYFTLAYDLQTMDSRFCQIPLPAVPNFCAAVDDGLWISYGNKIAFLSGDSPEEFTYTEKAGYAAYSGKGITTEAGKFIKGSSGSAVLFPTRDGIFLGMNGGNFQNLSEEKVSIEEPEYFSGYVREEGGLTHLVLSLKAPGDEYNAYEAKTIPENPWSATQRVSLLEGST